MPITFYPHEDDLKKDVSATLGDKIEILLEGAERYKALVLDTSLAPEPPNPKGATPAEIKSSFNWDGLAMILRDTRALPEGNANDKRIKSERLLKLAEVYETLRSAKMQKLEAVRLALINEANLLRGGT